MEVFDLEVFGKVAGIRATGHRLIKLNEHSCRVVFELPDSVLPAVCHRDAHDPIPGAGFVFAAPFVIIGVVMLAAPESKACQMIRRGFNAG
jgi:hypothetical protein